LKTNIIKLTHTPERATHRANPRTP